MRACAQKPGGEGSAVSCVLWMFRNYFSKLCLVKLLITWICLRLNFFTTMVSYYGKHIFIVLFHLGEYLSKHLKTIIHLITTNGDLLLRHLEDQKTMKTHVDRQTKFLPKTSQHHPG